MRPTLIEDAPMSPTLRLLAAGFALLVLPGLALAKTAAEIDAAVDAALKEFYSQVDGAREFVAASRGVLVFPEVIKAGFGVGGEYGEGALRVDGKTVDYYATAAASIGLQLGAQAKTVVICFMQEQALADFRGSSGWEVGVDGSVAIVQVGGGVSLDSTTIRDPIVGFVFGRRGLMFNLSLEGSKFTRLNR
jgi:lipid-binding SYLF domain-containing protein